MLPITDLSLRAQHILQSIVRAHIDSGAPVASQDVSRLRRHNLSAASVRNVMAELASQGYLDQAHASAGRVPTARAYQAYVRLLGSGRITSAELDRIRERLDGKQTMEARVEETSRLLTGMTSGVGIAAAMPTGSQILHQAQLLLLEERRVLMVVVTRDRMVRNQVVTLDEPVTQEELTSIANFLNRHYSGHALSAVRTELRVRMEQASTAYHEMLRKLIVLYDSCVSEAQFEPELHLDGASNLVSFDLHLTRERLRAIFQTLEEKKRILQLLDRFLEPPSDDLVYQIGLGEQDENFGELSLIGMSVRMPGGLTGKIAVLGPMRMNYERALSAVRHVSRAIQSMDERA